MENQTDNMNNKKNDKTKKMYVTSVIALILAVALLIGVTLSWFFNKRELDSLTWIKTPICLDIRSGNDHDIAYLDLGSIDADTQNRTIERVFCVYGEPVDIYSLQLSYTTNIPFYYDIYRASYAPKDGNVVFTYTDENGEHTEKFSYASNSTPVILPIQNIPDMPSRHPAHPSVPLLQCLPAQSVYVPLLQVLSQPPSDRLRSRYCMVSVP